VLWLVSPRLRPWIHSPGKHQLTRGLLVFFFLVWRMLPRAIPRIFLGTDGGARVIRWKMIICMLGKARVSTTRVFILAVTPKRTYRQPAHYFKVAVVYLLAKKN
jgi:hypothetical protein